MANQKNDPVTSKSKMQKVQIRNRKGAEGSLSVGSNMEVLLDGVPIRGATFIKFEVNAKKVAKVIIELFAEVEIDANLLLDEPQPTKDGKKFNSKGVSQSKHVISSYAPTIVRAKE